MARTCLILLGLVLVLVPKAGTARFDEGMWLPTALATDLPWELLKKRGMTVTPGEIWSDNAPSLKDAMLQIGQPSESNANEMQGYGSGAFVSAKGLILTNHHVAFDAAAALSTPERDIIQAGYEARDFEKELPCENLRVQVTTAIKDVTAQVLDGVADDSPAGERERAIRKNTSAILKAAHDAGDLNCRVEGVLEGLKYYLFSCDMFRDVRLVYMPPLGIGEYGGDTDNWMWPRHTGDFAYLRAYVAPDGAHAAYSKDNVPYKPKQHLKVSIAGYEPGNACFIMGYPGRTTRYRDSNSIDFNEKVNYPRQVEQFKQIISQIEESTKGDREAQIKNASDLKSLQNTLKNNEGMIEGLRRTKLAQRRAEDDKTFQTWIEADPARKAKYGHILPRMAEIYAGLRRTTAADAWARIMLSTEPSALTVYYLAVARDQLPAGQARRIVNDTKKKLADQDLEAQQRDLAAALDAFAKLDESEAPAALSDWRAKLAETNALAAELLPEPLNAERTAELLDMKKGDAPKLEGGLADFAKKIAQEMKEAGGAAREIQTTVPAMRRELMAAFVEYKKTPLYPDANLTLRFTHGTVRGYQPRDGVDYRYYTTIDGMLAKDKGAGEFNVPAALKEAAAKKEWGRYADTKTGVLQTCFLSDTDITGGNSGSPIMNGKGEMIGIAFDGIWEAMTSDWQFQPDITRTISVDIRYVLWITEKVAKLQRLIDEIEIAGN
jgi:hypothetical protein